jgi:uncharacterized protein (TIGR02594 family)
MPSTTEYQVTAVTLNVRKGPTIKAEPVGYLHKGDIVEHVDVSGDGYWLKVSKGELEGWCSHKYLSLLIPATEDEEFPWMPIALSEVGIKEFPGDKDNPRIVEYLKSTTLGAPDDSNDETKWCSAFVNWCVERAGYEGTDSAWALSWLNWGKKALTPRDGCVVVLKPGPDSRHVGFYVGETASHVKILGGNQSNEVNVTKFKKSGVVGYRLPG